nr:glutathione S-transferase 2-like [Chrysemys picta bellii]
MEEDRNIAQEDLENLENWRNRNGMKFNSAKCRVMNDLPSCSLSPGPDYDTSQWTNEKEKLGLDFPNLPYLIDGQTKLTQSNAILRYVARKHKMAGESEEEIQRVDMLENQVMDFRLAFARICYSPDFEKLKPEYLEQLPGKLKLFSQFLGVRKWFAGEKVCR